MSLHRSSYPQKHPNLANAVEARGKSLILLAHTGDVNVLTEKG